MIDFEKLVVAGKIEQYGEETRHEQVLKDFGKPDILEPARKSYPMMIVYGNLEFFFRNNRLEAAILACEGDVLDLPNTISVMHFPTRRERTVDYIKEILKKNKVAWNKDLIMSDEDQDVYITDRDVQLAFHKGILTRLAVTYGKELKEMIECALSKKL